MCMCMCQVGLTDTPPAQRYDNRQLSMAIVALSIKWWLKYVSYIVSGADVFDSREVAFTGHDHSIFSLDGLHMECSTVGIRDSFLHKRAVSAL